MVVLSDEFVDELGDRTIGVGVLEPRLETFGTQVLKALVHVLRKMLEDAVELVDGVVVDQSELLNRLGTGGELMDQVLRN